MTEDLPPAPLPRAPLPAAGLPPTNPPVDDLSALLVQQVPSSDRPLQGLTVLLVEDSRFASEAMRLLCLRSGARIRRADSLRAAHRHLATYRPSVVIIDMGLPDGSGADLIRELSAMQPRLQVILGTSGSDDAESLALAAGADGFLAKPVESLALFQGAVLASLPPTQRPSGPRALPGDVIHPDRLALRDDLALAAGLLAAEGGTDGAAAPQGAALDYLAQFLGGVARISHDSALADAATALQQGRATGRETRADLTCLSRLVQARLAAGSAI